MSQEKLNVIWLLVDSVRNYRTGIDDRDRLAVMDKLAEECLEFEKVIVSAPSSVMSVSAMMTGVPSYQIARDYENFKFDPQAFTSLPQILSARGYQTVGLPFFSEGRDKFKNLFSLIDKKYWPRGLKYGKKYWSNDDMNHILQNFINRGLKEPFFLFAHYDVRNDPQTSEKVEKIINLFKEREIFQRSIFILSSDHGYPDPSRGMGPKWFKDRGLSHDMVLTNDNIFIPLLLKYPGSESMKILTAISTLDITPTIMELLEIRQDSRMKGLMQGRSLLPLIEGKVRPEEFESRYIRVDNRFLCQTGRCTALFHRDKKYVFSYDDNRESFFDLAEDPLEIDSLVNENRIKDELAEFRKTFSEMSHEANLCHFKYVLNGIRSHLSQPLDSGHAVLLVDVVSNGRVDFLIDIIHEALQPSAIDLITSQDSILQYHGDKIRKVMSLDEANSNFRSFSTEIKDYAKIVVWTNKKSQSNLRFINKKCQNILFIDSNMDVIDRHHRGALLLKRVQSRLRLYLREPLIFVDDVKRRLFKKP